MRTETIESGASAGLKLAHLAAKAAEGKILAEDLVEIGKRKAQRMVRRGRAAGEDYLDEATHHIKQPSLAGGWDRRRRRSDYGVTVRLELFASAQIKKARLSGRASRLRLPDKTANRSPGA